MQLINFLQGHGLLTVPANIDSQTICDNSGSQAYLLLPLSWGGLSGNFCRSGLITITAITRQASSILAADDCFKLSCSAEYLQIPLTQQTTATTVTEGTEMLPETKKMDETHSSYICKAGTHIV